MSSKTRIVVLHLKEVIYTGIFVALGILFIVLLIIMFLPDKDESKTPSLDISTDEAAETSYIPGIYTSSLILGEQTIDVEVIIDYDRISSIRLVNLSESVTTMYPLIKPSFEALVKQIYENQSVNNITYADENKYTSLVLLQAIETVLKKAAVTLEIEEGILP